PSHVAPNTFHPYPLRFNPRLMTSLRHICVLPILRLPRFPFLLSRATAFPASHFRALRVYPCQRNRERQPRSRLHAAGASTGFAGPALHLRLVHPFLILEREFVGVRGHDCFSLVRVSLQPFHR